MYDGVWKGIGVHRVPTRGRTVLLAICSPHRKRHSNEIHYRGLCPKSERGDARDETKNEVLLSVSVRLSVTPSTCFV